MMTIYRNKKLLALAKDAPYCMRCRNPNDGTVVPAHANMGIMGKGMGIKAADIPAFLCHHCHDVIDGRERVQGMTRDMRDGQWAIAAALTMRWVLENHPEVFAQ